MSSLFAAKLPRYRHLLLLVLCAVSSVVSSFLLVFLPPQLQPFFVAATIMALLSILSLMRPLVFLAFVMLSAVFAGYHSFLGSLAVGRASLSVSGLRWGYVALFLIVLIGLNAKRIHLPPVVWPMAAFVAYAATRWLWSGPDGPGLKDLLFYSLPLMTLVYLGTLGPRDRQRTSSVALQIVFVGVFLRIAAYFVLLWLGMVHITPYGPDGVIRPRPTGLFLLVALALSLASSRYAISQRFRRYAAVVAVLSLGLVLFTLSRTASVVAFILVATHRVNPLKLRQLIAWGLFGATLFLTLVFAVPLLQERFFFQSDLSPSESIGVLNTMGRSARWQITWDSARFSPLFGQGLGSARELMALRLSESEADGGGHPHNEYLQVFHDLGIVGVSLLLLGWLALLKNHWSCWRAGVRSGDDCAAMYNMMAFFGIICVFLTAITDNTLHYGFVMVPVSLLSALALRAAICDTAAAQPPVETG